MIYKLFSSWGPKNVNTRTRILDIAIFVGILVLKSDLLCYKFQIGQIRSIQM